MAYRDIKGKLRDIDCPTQEDLKSAIIALIDGIGNTTVVVAFRSWVERLRWMIKNQGDTTIGKRERRSTALRFDDNRAGRELLDPRD
jgi:hypothetical protein